MKKFSFLAIAALGLLFAACSDSETVAESPNNPLKQEGVGYIKVGLNLPSTPSTRSWGETADLQSGTVTTEYAVDNVLLILFGSTTDDETAAKVVQVKTLTNSWNNVTPNNPDQVTTNHSEVVELTEASTNSAYLYALAVVNGTGILEAGTAGKLKVLKDDGTAQEELAYADVTLAKLQKALSTTTTDASGFVNGSNHIFMTNAVLSNVRGGSSTPGSYPGTDDSKSDKHILAPVNKSLIAATEAEANTGNPAVDIYVERAVAKVTLASVTTTISGITLSGTGTLAATFNGWCLANTNTKSYVVRNVPDYAANTFKWDYVNEKSSETEKYRFVGLNPVDAEYSTASAGYRTYWAVDPNYTGDASSELYTPDLTKDETYKGKDNIFYVNENTFNVDQQVYKNTTTAVFKVTFSPGSTKDLFTVGADHKTIYDEEAVGTLIANALMANSDFVDWFNANKKTGVTKVVTGDLTLKWNVSTAGSIKLDNVTVGTTAFTAEKPLNPDCSNATAILNNVNDQVSNIKRYKGGVSYYAVRIWHFGNDLTPWDSGESSPAPAESTETSPTQAQMIAAIYPGTGDTRNANYLGRYGLVRNNWYDITITNITKVGAATPDELELDGDHPDDKKEDAYIKARINILSWAKRTQSWSLK